MAQASKILLDCGVASETLSTLHAPYPPLTGERATERTASRKQPNPSAHWALGPLIGGGGSGGWPNKPGFPEFSGAQTPTCTPARKRPRRGLARDGLDTDVMAHLGRVRSRSECDTAGELC
ncbi:hypothetical protein Baya_11650 [Bagarius yarrelli]|uniref:Uncharacterized protein n=1 Tax=Bagarius yarrelli TaxID=175774 RepID=A0A556V1C9_BAGYA|nr:hypothetical protein Baya_11650 [Bagarius yarrelli]